MLVLQPNFFETLRPKKRLQPVCSVCEKTLVQEEGGVCPGCETFAHVHDRAVSEDQAPLGRF